MELQTMTALELSKKIRQRQVKVADGVKEVFDQIEKKEGKVHAYLDLYKKDALARAKEVEKESWTAFTPDRLPECDRSQRQHLHQRQKNNLRIKNIRELRTTV